MALTLSNFWSSLRAQRSNPDSRRWIDASHRSSQLRKLRNHQTGERRAHQVGEAPGQKSTKTELGDHGPLVGREIAGHGHLDGNRAEIGETAQGKSDDLPA